MNVFERSGDLVAMTSVSDLVNGWTGGIIQAVAPRRLRHADLPGEQALQDIWARSAWRSRLKARSFDSSREGQVGSRTST